MLQRSRTENPCPREASHFSQIKELESTSSSDRNVQNQLSTSQGNSEESCPALGQSLNVDCRLKRSILVGAADIHKSVDLISDLKHRFNFEVVVRSGLGVSFLLSQRLGVQRYFKNPKSKSPKHIFAITYNKT